MLAFEILAELFYNSKQKVLDASDWGQIDWGELFNIFVYFTNTQNIHFDKCISHSIYRVLC